MNKYMGFPVSCRNIFFPKIIHDTLSFLGLIKDIIYALLFYPSVQDLYDPDVYWLAQPGTRPELSCISTALMRKLLPVIKFSELVESPESCAVCLCVFSGEDEIRRLMNCRHVFHRNCVDRWMDHDHDKCPLCRTPFIGEDVQEAFNQRLWTASGISDYYGE